mgnify:CR=1 FL=1
MATLKDNINTIKGIGEKRAQAFARLGVFTLYDLLCFFPRRYEDRSVIVPIAEAVDGYAVCISAVVADDPRLSRIRRGMELVKFRVFDASGAADITYFRENSSDLPALPRTDAEKCAAECQNRAGFVCGATV